MAFVTLPGALPRSASSRPDMRRCPVTCALKSTEPVSRRSLLAGIAALAGLSAVPGNASAASGTGLEKAVSKYFFPKEGFNAPDAPLAGSIDRSVLESAEGQAALKTLKGYQSKVDELYAEFKNDPQTKLNAKVKEAFQISELRKALNTFDEAFDEDAQKETDKVVRGIIQDIGELQTAAALKEGATRTKKKIERTQDWFEKLVGDFKKLLSFYA